MKKIFLFAAAAMVSLSSCVQSESVYTGKLNEIGFKSAVTRKIVQTQADFTQPIAVVGVLDNTLSDGIENYAPYFLPEKYATFIYDAGTATWKGDPTRYWPSFGKMDFLAFCPNPVTATLTPNFDPTTGRIQNITVSGIDNNIVDQHDILYSDLVSDVVAPKSSAEALQFHHALAQIQVAFKKTDSAATVILNSVVLENILVGGTMVITPVVGSESLVAWTTVDSPKNRYFLKDLSVSGIENGTLNEALVHDSEYPPLPLLTIPMAQQTKIKITYTIDGHQQIYEHDLAVNGAWEAGFKYIYHFTINVNEIIFSCTVDPWEEKDYMPGTTI